MNNHLRVRQPSSGNPSNSLFFFLFAATIQLPQLRERNCYGPTVSLTQFAAQPQGSCCWASWSVDAEEMCHSSRREHRRANLHGCSRSQPRYWLMFLGHSSPVIALQVTLAQLHCSFFCWQSSQSLSSGTKISLDCTADTALNNCSCPLHLLLFLGAPRAAGYSTPHPQRIWCIFWRGNNLLTSTFRLWGFLKQECAKLLGNRHANKLSSSASWLPLCSHLPDRAPVRLVLSSSPSSSTRAKAELPSQTHSGFP